MIASPNRLRGRLAISGPVFFLLAALLLPAWSFAGDDPTRPHEMTTALAQIEKLKAATPRDLDALHAAYLVLFENFPRHQESQEAIFDLYYLLRTAGRTTEAHAVLVLIQAVCQDHETMGWPKKEKSRLSLTATARIEEAFLFAGAMNNPYQAIDILKQTLARYQKKNVGLIAPDRNYFGRVEVITRLELARYRLQIGTTNSAAAELLAVVRDWPGATVVDAGVETTAPVAAVRRLPEVLAAMPASRPQKESVLATFEQTVIEAEAKVWLAFTRANVDFAHAEKWKNKGAFADGAFALRGIIKNHRNLMLHDATGREPAGIKAMLRLRDAEAIILGNITQAGQTLQEFHNRFAKNRNDRLFAGYALLFLAELELDFRKNAPSAFNLFMQVADDYGDLPLFPRKNGEEITIAQHAKLWAKRAQERM